MRRALGASLFAATAGSSFGRMTLRVAREDETPRKAAKPRTLVVVFLRGGADGLNVVVPHGQDAYHRLRPGIAIPRAGERGGALDLGDGFGLHPSLAPLLPLAKSGALAAIHAVGHPDNTRSHFEEQDRWELAAPGADLRTAGWLNRYLAASDPQGPIRAIALGRRVPRSLRGDVAALAVPGLGDLAGDGGGDSTDATLAALERAYGGADASMRGAASSTLTAMEALRHVAKAKWEHPGEYPQGEFSARMRDVSRIVRSGLGVEVIQLDLEGFDTHRNQPQALAARLSELGASIAALHDDLAATLDDVLVVTVSEFGRTARVNGTRGTDHGSGGCVLAMGGRLRAKDAAAGDLWRGVLGDWPGLERDELHERRDLRVTTDVRDVYAEVLTRFLGVSDAAALLPEWSPKPLGLVARPA